MCHEMLDSSDRSLHSPELAVFRSICPALFLSLLTFEFIPLVCRRRLSR